MQAPCIGKHPFYDINVRRCSTKFRKIHRKNSVLDSLFLLKKRLKYRCFPVNFAKILKTPSLQNTSERLLLIFVEILLYNSYFLKNFSIIFKTFLWRCFLNFLVTLKTRKIEVLIIQSAKANLKMSILTFRLIGKYVALSSFGHIPIKDA